MGLDLLSRERDIQNRERQATLSLRWETRHHWRAIAEAIQPQRQTETIAAVALALLTEADGQDRWTSYSRAKTHYARPRRYVTRLYGYRQVVAAMDELERLELILHDRRRPGERGWQSAVYPTPKLLGIVRSALNGNTPEMTRLQEPLWLRDESKDLIDYDDTGMTRRMRNELHAQNEAIQGTDMGQVLPFPGRLRRIFNTDFNHGGRFYAEGGSWQTLSKEERLRITLDGEPVVEVDYATFHPALAYAERGLRPPDDSYDIPAFPRDLVKIAFNVMLNSAGRPGARHTIAWKSEMLLLLQGPVRHADELPQDYYRRASGHDQGFTQKAHSTADALIDAILAKHRPIEHFFFTQAGLQLQRLDSDIAAGVMREMRRFGILVLPIHDSFLVAASKADLLEGAMVTQASQRGAKINCTRSPSVPIA